MNTNDYIGVEEIRSRANKLLQDQGMHDLPIDPVSLAKKMGIKVRGANFNKSWISGGLQVDENKNIIIYVKSSDPPNRQRFTIAHEIGHKELHSKDIGKTGILEKIDMFRDTNDKSCREMQANEFAASILMPEREVKRLWSFWESVDVLADIFAVSVSAISYRLYKLGLRSEW